MVKGISFKGVKKITDTAGFEPLDVKIKRFMLSGEIAKLHVAQFDSYDYREMFNSIPTVEYDGDEEIEETREKMMMLMSKKKEILERKLASFKSPATPDTKEGQGENDKVVSPPTVDKE